MQLKNEEGIIRNRVRKRGKEGFEFFDRRVIHTIHNLFNNTHTGHLIDDFKMDERFAYGVQFSLKR